MERGVPIRSVSRSIAVLQCINRHGSLSLMEIARGVDLPYPTTFRIIQTLIHEGLIECEPARKHYRVTQLVQSLSVGYRDRGRLLRVARQAIVELTRKVSWPISVVTHVGQSMMVRDSTHTQTSLTFSNYEPGYTMPMLECASGHAYLAHLDDAERHSLLDGIETFERRTHMLEMFRSDKLAQRIREDGYATCDRNPHTANPGKTSSISVPIFEHGHVTGALTLVFFSSAMPMAEAVRRYAEDLKACARALNDELARDELPPPLPLPSEVGPYDAAAYTADMQAMPQDGIGVANEEEDDDSEVAVAPLPAGGRAYRHPVARAPRRGARLQA